MAEEKGKEITTEVKKPDALQALLQQDAIKRRFETVLGKKAPGFMSSIISATSANKDLKKADPISIVQSAAVAAALDLPINSSLGFAHIVPYKKDGVAIAQFQMGWKGFVQLGMRTGQYKTINVAIVREGELISRNRFTGEMVFDESKKTGDKTIGYVAYFRLINGFEKYFYMTAEEAKAHGKKYSKSFNKEYSRWQTDFDSMALKTVIKMLLSKWGILSIEMQTAIQADQAIVKGEGEYEYPDNDSDVIEGEIEEGDAPKTTAQELKERFPGKTDQPVCPKGGFITKELCATCKDKLPDCPEPKE